MYANLNIILPTFEDVLNGKVGKETFFVSVGEPARCDVFRK